MQKLNIKRLFLYLLIGSISVSAFLGVSIILFGNFGEIELRVLLTTLVVAVISILGLACGACLEAKRRKILPYAGIASSIIAGTIWIAIIWVKEGGGEFIFKFVTSVTILAVALSHLSLISLARLDQRFRWAIYAIFSVVGILVAFLFGLIWATDSFSNEATYRLLGVLTILSTALTIVVPVFHKLSDNLDEGKLIDDEIAKLKLRIDELEKRKEKFSNYNND